MSDHESPALRALLAKWGLVDALPAPDDKGQMNMQEHFERTHTYRYPLPSGQEATARLDRWYLSAPLLAWAAAVEVCHPGTKADHQAVQLHLRNPEDPVRLRKPPRVYPPPAAARTAVQTEVERLLSAFSSALPADVHMDAVKTAADWDVLKAAVRKHSLLAIKRCRQSARATYQQRIKRLRRQERRLQEAEIGVVASVDSITDSLDALTLDEAAGSTPLQRVRSAITDCLRARAASKQRRMFREASYHMGKTSKPFFRRVSNKFADNAIHRLDAATGQPERGVHEKADTLADAWTPIFQQAPSRHTDRMDVLSWLGASDQYKELLSDPTEPFTEAEVAAAIGASKPGKACGPDRLGNDWYRDFSTPLIPILTRLFNCWYAAGHFPPSFMEAEIFCLKKSGDSRNPLNFRPLSLLDTDYKILTRMIATRTSQKLGRIIHPHQNGFVPHRTIHATVDLFHAAQAVAMADPTYAEALAILLDFCKAYDSVDRAFLYDVLQWLGFPPEYVTAIRRMHDGTTARFLANGYKSRRIQVHCGIRQGCPLAPILFILVLEALYRRIDNEPQVLGITLKNKEGAVQLKVGGFADDTASYVRSVAEVLIVMALTRAFALASGLHLNEGKTLVIALNPTKVDEMGQLPSPLHLQPTHSLARYLGLQVGSTPDPDYTWQLASTQLVTRLALATRKTATVDQRSMVAAAITIPKLLYIGRHQWPSTQTVRSFQKRIHNFVWHARFTVDRVSGRAWLDGHIAFLPRKLGGIAIPDLKTELLAMAAVTINKWALDSSREALVIGDVLISQGSDTAKRLTYVSHSTPLSGRTPQLGDSLWTTGVRVCNYMGGVGMVEKKAEMVQALHALSYFRGPVLSVWRGRRLWIETVAMHGTLSQAVIAKETKQHGTFCGEWLPFLGLADLRLFSETGRLVNPNTRFRLLRLHGSRLNEVVHWQWTAAGNLLVTVLIQAVTAGVRRQIAYLMHLLVLNFPQLLFPGDHGGTVRYSTKVVEHTHITRRLNRARMIEDPSTDTVASPAREQILNHRDLHAGMQAAVGHAVRVLKVHPHPRLARMVCLWDGSKAWAVTRSKYKQRLTVTSTAKGRSNTEQRHT